MTCACPVVDIEIVFLQSLYPPGNLFFRVLRGLFSFLKRLLFQLLSFYNYFTNSSLNSLFSKRLIFQLFPCRISTRNYNFTISLLVVPQTLLALSTLNLHTLKSCYFANQSVDFISTSSEHRTIQFVMRLFIIVLTVLVEYEELNQVGLWLGLDSTFKPT